MAGLRPALLTLAMSCFLTSLSAAVVEAQAPGASVLNDLRDGARIRTNGPAVRDEIGVSFRDVLRGGFMALLIRPAAEGLVVEATSESLHFAESQRRRQVEIPWSGVDYVDLYRGRSVGVGTLQGAGLGAMTGLVAWGVIELIFLAADNPVVDEPEVIVGIMAAAGGLLGAATLGDRWDRVYPAR